MTPKGWLTASSGGSLGPGTGGAAKASEHGAVASSSLPVLDWFPKPFRGGDHDGTGEAKLLGTSDVGLVDVIVREMAQNSWDARTGRRRLVFGIRLHQLGPDAMAILREHVFRDGTGRLPLGSLLRGEAMWVLEVSDRGTHGLDGPVRNDLRYEPDDPTNFVDLVLSVGSPQDKEGGGGTYGFGKTAAFKAGETGAVIYWSHSREKNALESRFIASGIGPNFVKDGRRFTGRHWWGRPSDDGTRPEPVTGADADRLAGGLFEGGFEPDETGTSILILGPKFDVGPDGEEVDPQSYMNAVRDAVLANLWPKLIRDSAARTMDIELGINGHSIEIPDPETESALRPFVECLRAVRTAQNGARAGGGGTTSELVKVTEVHSQRPARLLGHLALVRLPVSAAPHDVGFGGEAHHVCLMRHDAELVVKYMPMRELETGGYQWGGVFKPTKEIDPAFAASEPPTHDEWNAASLRRPDSVYVNVALRKIRELVQDFLSPSPVEMAPDRGDMPSVVNLANRLSGFVVSTPSSRASAHVSRASANRGGRRKPIAEIVAYQDVSWKEGWRHFAAEVHVKGGGSGVTEVRATVGVMVEGGGREADEDAVRLLGWSERPGGEPTSTRTMHMIPAGGSRWVHIRSREDLAVDLRVSVESG